MVFDTSESGRIMRMDFSILAAAMPAELPSDYLLSLRYGSDAQAFAIRVNRTARNFLTVDTHRTGAAAFVISTINFVVVIMALVLAAIAVAAVFNTVLLNTRERSKDTAILT